MFASYFKTALRVMRRNKAFSFINIFGLAASMSVGLLFISIVHDVIQFDSFHEKKERIYRVTSTDVEANGNGIPLASSSVVLGREIRAKVGGVESITTLGWGFRGDFDQGTAVLPLSGFWAEPSFFEVFSFPLLSGDMRTALNDPHSVILTEKAAIKMFGTTDVLGRPLSMKSNASTNSEEYVITGVLRDLPKFSHIQFEALASFSSIDPNRSDMLDWGNIWSNYTYVVINENVTTDRLLESMKKLEQEQNALFTNGKKVLLGLQPMTRITFLGERLDNQHGPVMPPRFLWLISGLSIIVLMTACFNYTNLSIARASRRMREVGIRKVIGAKRRQVMWQFVAESVVVCLAALLFAFVLFTLIRQQFLLLTPNLGRLFDLHLTTWHLIVFVLFAIATGLLSGLVPGVYFSKVKVAEVMRGLIGLKAGRLNFRKALIVVQYVFALAFITATVILYKQYKDFVSFDLGFNTRNIVNINLQRNPKDVLETRLLALPDVSAVSASYMVTSTGDNYYTHVKYNGVADSLRAWYNKIDERYLNVLGFSLVSGQNLHPRNPGAPESEAIVNKALLEQLKIATGDPQLAIGETIIVEGQSLVIVGVVDNFHYSTLSRAVGPFLFRQLERPRFLQVKINSPDLSAAMAHLNEVWKTIDPVHPLQAEFYDRQIEFTYREYSSIGKVVGYLAFLTVIISSLGLLGMVVFAAETRMKEMGIRRVLGARTVNVTYLLGSNFLLLLVIAAVIAIPGTWFFFTNVVLSNVVYHKPIGVIELLAGALVVGAIALGVVMMQGWRVARRNPAEVLKAE